MFQLMDIMIDIVERSSCIYRANQRYVGLGQRRSEKHGSSWKMNRFIQVSSCALRLSSSRSNNLFHKVYSSSKPISMDSPRCSFQLLSSGQNLTHCTSSFDTIAITLSGGLSKWSNHTHRTSASSVGTFGFRSKQTLSYPV